MAAQQYGSKFFQNGGSISGFLSYPGQLTKEARDSLKEQWSDVYGGSKNAGKTAVLEEGAKYERLGIPPEEAQFLETRKFQTEEIARIYRVPLHLLQNLERATFSNIEHQSIEFVQYTMLPWFERWESFCDAQLLTSAEREQGYFCEFLITSLLRGDQKARAAMLHVMRNDGIICADEWREMENMNPQPTGIGTKYLINGNFTSIEELGGDKIVPISEGDS